ncbi:AAA family ATPase [Paracoccus sp. ME4]|uniref:AAA family ATPase n=1 Tax=Paracoccus sp. ME4 TaxID=3138066 RepID=UPI00398B705C
MNKKIRRRILFAASAAVLLAAGVFGPALLAPEEPVWSERARVEGESISYSEMRKKILDSGREDRVMIYSDMIVFEDRQSSPVDAGSVAASADAAPGDPAAGEGSVPIASDPTSDRTATSLIDGSERFSALISYGVIGGEAGTFDGAQAEIFYGDAQDGGMTVASAVNTSMSMVFLGIFLFLAFRMLGGDRGGAASIVDPKELKEGLDDIAGLDTARAQAREMIDLIRNDGRIGKIGARPPKGILLSGPPGNGKTLLARAMARDAGLSFMSLDASGLHQTFVGVGPSRVRKAFKKARENAPCIIFIDEIDAIGARGTGNGGSVEKERDNLINALLVQMDGLSPDSGIFVVAATNRPDQLDPALIRPGRIDRRITVSLPDMRGREAILRLHAMRLPLGGDVDLARIAATTPGMSGADLAALCNEAGIAAGRDGTDKVMAAHFAQARQRLMLGDTASGMILSEAEREIIAWHEAGHAVAAVLSPNSDPVEHATILPSGSALGHVLQVPEADRNLETRSRLMSRMLVLAAGRAAEELRFGADNVTNGAASDIAALTDIATGMVTKWGMGPHGFLRVTPAMGTDFPPAVLDEIRTIANGAKAEALRLLQDNEAALGAVAGALLERDTLPAEEIRHLVATAA